MSNFCCGLFAGLSVYLCSALFGHLPRFPWHHSIQADNSISMLIMCLFNSIVTLAPYYSLTPILSGVYRYPHVQPVVISTFAAPPFSELIPFTFVSLYQALYAALLTICISQSWLHIIFFPKSPFLPQLLSTFPAQ